jgi:hypothetical protein
MKKYLSLIALGLLLAGGSVYAMPSYIAPTVQTATATTSPVFLVDGTSTSTLTYDTYTGGNNYLADKAVLAMQFAGSSTSAVLGINLEYSQDGIDWYQNDLNSGATTTRAINLQPRTSYSWTFASTTIGGILPTTTNTATSTKVLFIDTPLRYVRAVFSISGANGAIWGQIIPIKQKMI